MKNRTMIVQGFQASAVSAGIKNEVGLDLGLIVSQKEAVASALFTTNQVKAAPVILSQKNLRKGKVRAIIANSGNANACTGEAGLRGARVTTQRVAEELGVGANEVLVASTGVIGAQLDTNRINDAVPGLVRSLLPEGIPRVAEAIMTTDSFPKMSLYDGEAGGKPYRVAGIAKGAGMIMPHMATMLCFVVSNLVIGEKDLSRALRVGVENTFNRITVDGDTSTNDMTLIMANGMAGNGPLSQGEYEGFREGLTHVLTELAKMIVRDGEGATKLVTLHIKGASTADDALRAARTVANSLLVKTAFYGQDPNWGRVMAALGRSDIHMDEKSVSIWLDDVRIVEAGLGTGVEEEKKAAEKMKAKEFSLTIDLHQGSHEERILTSDLTHDYVSINADYRS